MHELKTSHSLLSSVSIFIPSWLNHSMLPLLSLGHLAPLSLAHLDSFDLWQLEFYHYSPYQSLPTSHVLFFYIYRSCNITILLEFTFFNLSAENVYTYGMNRSNYLFRRDQTLELLCWQQRIAWKSQSWVPNTTQPLVSTLCINTYLLIPTLTSTSMALYASFQNVG